MKFKTTILLTEFVTHNVKRFLVQRPDDFSFSAGQGVELAIDDSGLKDESRPFTPTSLYDDGILEFTIKRYPDHDGVTKELHNRKAGTTLLLSECFGTIKYTNPGVFIAGGAGITPFLAIFREQAVKKEGLGKSSLIFSNKRPEDIICEKELRYYFAHDSTFVCTADRFYGYDNGRIDKEYLQKKIVNYEQSFYVCGPPSFVDNINDYLQELGADTNALIFEN